MSRPIPYSPADLDTMARTVWAEARGEGQKGMEAVAWVIRNRLETPGWWSRHPDAIPDDTIAAVCREPWQFSCWNPRDPNLPKLLAVTDMDRHFAAALAIIRGVLAGEPTDPTNGADHYLVTSWIPRTPWAKANPGRVRARIGAHTFYHLGKGG